MNILKRNYKLLLLSFILLLSIYSKDLAYAQTIEIDNCDNDLDQPNTRYLLTGDIVGNCRITANGIIIDGQDLWSVTGAIMSGGYGSGLPDGEDAPDINLENLTLNGLFRSEGGYATEFLDAGNGGNVNIVNSILMIKQTGYAYGAFTEGRYPGHDGDYNITTKGSKGGNITISSSQIIKDHSNNYARVASLGYTGGGDISLYNTIVDDVYFATQGFDLRPTGYDGGNITLNKVIANGVFDNGYSHLPGAFISKGGGDVGNYNITLHAGNAGNISITESYIEGGVVSQGGVGTETNGSDGVVELINLAPELTLEPLSETITMEDIYDPYAGTISAEDFIDGDLTSDISIDGLVGPSAGIYELTYSVSDNGLSVESNGVTITAAPLTTSKTRTITRFDENAPEPEQTPSEEPSRRSSSRSVPSSLQAKNNTLNSIVLQYKDSLTTLHTLGIISLPQNILDILNIQTTNTTNTTFLRDLTLGDTGTDVSTLQSILISKGYSIPAGPTGYFGEQTRQAVASFQRDNGIVPALGYFGTITRGIINNL